MSLRTVALQAARTLTHTLTLPLLVLPLLLTSSSQAAPITYTGFVITDGAIGGTPFHNARVILTFESDTSNVQDTVIVGVHVFYNQTGTGRVSIVADNVLVIADFLPNQLFVSVDKDNGGIGFGSFAPDGSVQPTYPLGVYGDMISAALPIGKTFDPSPELAGLSPDLSHNVGIAGLGRTCSVGPVLPLHTVCPIPTVPLQTSRGDLFLFEPYNTVTTGNALNAGFFFADLGDHSRTLPAEVFTPSLSKTSGPIAYHALLYSDVFLGGSLFRQAKILFTLTSNTSSVAPIPGSDPNAYMSSQGIARVSILTSDGRTVRATFSPNQIYVYFSPLTYTLGFGSTVGGSGYPLGIGAGGCLCFGEVMTGFALSEILDDPTSASDFSPPTSLLVGDLRHEVALAGNAYSCDPFVIGAGCADLSSPPKLTTDRGDFYVYEPFTRGSQYSGPSVRISSNATVLWASFDAPSEREDSGDDE